MKFIQIIATILGLFFLSLSPTLAKDTTYEAVITAIKAESSITAEGQQYLNQTLELRILNKDQQNKIIELETQTNTSISRYQEGDKLSLIYTRDETTGEENYYPQDYVRRNELLLLFIIFVALVLFIGRFWGLSSLLGMTFSFLVIFNFILPQIIKGNDPVITAILGACAIIPATFYLSHGVSSKTVIAIIGTLITLIFTGFLASLFVGLTHLTGFAAEESSFLQFELQGKINMKGLLLAGIIISVLGILDDITISQASIVKELKDANKKLKFVDLFNRAMNVGRDHIASLTNTLVLVYAGASLPLLLLFINNPRPFAEIINYEIVADEIVRTLVGSISLVLAVPITTFIAALHYANKRK